MNKKATTPDEDVNEMIETNNEIVIAAGKKPLFDTIEDLDRLMESEEPITF